MHFVYILLLYHRVIKLKEFSTLWFSAFGCHASSQTTILLTFNWVKLSIFFLMRALLKSKDLFLYSLTTLHYTTLSDDKLLKRACFVQIKFYFVSSDHQYSMNIKRQTNFIDLMNNRCVSCISSNLNKYLRIKWKFLELQRTVFGTIHKIPRQKKCELQKRTQRCLESWRTLLRWTIFN